MEERPLVRTVGRVLSVRHLVVEVCSVLAVAVSAVNRSILGAAAVVLEAKSIRASCCSQAQQPLAIRRTSGLVPLQARLFPSAALALVVVDSGEVTYRPLHLSEAVSSEVGLAKDSEEGTVRSEEVRTCRSVVTIRKAQLWRRCSESICHRDRVR